MTERPVVLYVEDNPQSCTLMEIMLVRRLGLQHVTIWPNSTDFPARLETLQPIPDIIFLDIHMKPYNGFEMLAMLREHDVYGEKPVVALTASVMSEEVYQLRTAGFSGCIAKPIDLGTFPDTLKRILVGEAVWAILD
jgi:CheY-like chemotaxis protein